MSDRSVLVASYVDGDRPLDGADGADRSGLALESTYLWALCRAGAGAAGPDIWSALRRLSTGPAWPARLLLQTNAGAAGIRRHQTSGQAARSVDVIAAGPGVWHADGFELTIDSATLRWSEGADGSLLALAGTEVTPGLQWCLPPGAGGDGMGYRSRIFRVAGSVDGLPVDGFVGCDEVRLAPGRQNYVDDPLTADHLAAAWCTWATAYDDGSVEAGHTAFGRDGFAFGLRSTDGVATITTNVSGTVTHDDRGCPARISFDIDGEAWEFVADARGIAAEPLPGPVRQAEGWCRRVGETRRPVVWCATPEVPAP